MKSVFLMVSLLAGLMAGSVHADEAAPRKPNIIYIMLDDAGYGDFGAFGSPHVKTPNFDQLCRDGMRFNQHYSGSAVCAPTRCVLMTGLHTGHCRRRDNMATARQRELAASDSGARGLVFLEPEDVTVAEALKSAGYTTGGIGKWGLGNPGTSGQPERQGFDYWFGYLDQVHAHDHFPDHIWDGGKMVELSGNVGGKKEQYVPYLQEEKALAFVEEHQEEPFFLYLALTPPHGAYEIPSEDPAYQLYANQNWQQQVKNYAGMITQVDRSVGKLLNKLEQLGLAEDTIVFYTSDNGPNAPFLKDLDSNGPFRGTKRELYEGGLRAAMAVRWPGKIHAGASSEFVWDMRDVFPTACELAGISPPSEIDGISVLPTLLGQTQTAHSHLYWEIHHPFQQAVRMGKWKAIRFGTQSPLELYNLDSDLAEANDVSHENPAVVTSIAAIMDNSRTDSPYYPAVTKKKRSSK